MVGAESVQVESTVTDTSVAPEPTRVSAAAEALEMLPTSEGEEAAEVEAAPTGIDAAQEQLEKYVAEEMEAEPEAAPVQSVGKEYRSLRKRRRQVEKREQEFTQKMEHFEAQQAKLEEGLELVRLMRENPEAAFTKFAELSGGDSDEFYERLTTQRLSGGEVPEESPAMKEVKRLREEMAERDQMYEDREAAAKKEHEEGQVLAAIDGYVGELCTIPRNEQYAEKWPHLAALRPDILEARSRYAVLWAVENSPETTLPELADALDGVVGEEYSYVLEKLNGSRGSGTPSQEVKPEGLGKPAVAKPKSLSLTNDDSAVTSRHGRDMSRTERVHAAASALPDLVAMLNN